MKNNSTNKRKKTISPLNGEVKNEIDVVWLKEREKKPEEKDELYDLLIQYVQKNDVEAVKYILDTLFMGEHRSLRNEAAYHKAVARAKFANQQKDKYKGNSAYHIAAKYKAVDIISFFNQKKKYPKVKNKSKNDRVYILYRLKNGNREVPLDICCQHGDINTFNEVLKRDDKKNKTPIKSLEMACENNHTEIVQRLLFHYQFSNKAAKEKIEPIKPVIDKALSEQYGEEIMKIFKNNFKGQSDSKDDTEILPKSINQQKKKRKTEKNKVMEKSNKKIKTISESSSPHKSKKTKKIQSQSIGINPQNNQISLEKQEGAENGSEEITHQEVSSLSRKKNKKKRVSSEPEMKEDKSYKRSKEEKEVSKNSSAQTSDPLKESPKKELPNAFLIMRNKGKEQSQQPSRRGKKSISQKSINDQFDQIFQANEDKKIEEAIRTFKTIFEAKKRITQASIAFFYQKDEFEQLVHRLKDKSELLSKLYEMVFIFYNSTLDIKSSKDVKKDNDLKNQKNQEIYHKAQCVVSGLFLDRNEWVIRYFKKLIFFKEDESSSQESEIKPIEFVVSQLKIYFKNKKNISNSSSANNNYHLFVFAIEFLTQYLKINPSDELEVLLKSLKKSPVGKVFQYLFDELSSELVKGDISLSLKKPDLTGETNDAMSLKGKDKPSTRRGGKNITQKLINDQFDKILQAGTDEEVDGVIKKFKEGILGKKRKTQAAIAFFCQKEEFEQLVHRLKNKSELLSKLYEMVFIFYNSTQDIKPSKGLKKDDDLKNQKNKEIYHKAQCVVSGLFLERNDWVIKYFKELILFKEDDSAGQKEEIKPIEFVVSQIKLYFQNEKNLTNPSLANNNHHLFVFAIEFLSRYIKDNPSEELEKLLKNLKESPVGQIFQPLFDELSSDPIKKGDLSLSIKQIQDAVESMKQRYLTGETKNFDSLKQYKNRLSLLKTRKKKPSKSSKVKSHGEEEKKETLNSARRSKKIPRFIEKHGNFVFVPEIILALEDCYKKRLDEKEQEIKANAERLDTTEKIEKTKSLDQEKKAIQAEMDSNRQLMRSMFNELLYHDDRRPDIYAFFGQLFYQGKIFSKNLCNARYLLENSYKKHAENMNIAALRCLAEIYYYGHGGKANIDLAKQVLSKAIKLIEKDKDSATLEKLQEQEKIYYLHADICFLDFLAIEDKSRIEKGKDSKKIGINDDKYLDSSAIYYSKCTGIPNAIFSLFLLWRFYQCQLAIAKLTDLYQTEDSGLLPEISLLKNLGITKNQYSCEFYYRFEIAFPNLKNMALEDGKIIIVPTHYLEYKKIKNEKIKEFEDSKKKLELMLDQKEESLPGKDEKFSDDIEDNIKELANIWRSAGIYNAKSKLDSFVKKRDITVGSEVITATKKLIELMTHLLRPDFFPLEDRKALFLIAKAKLKSYPSGQQDSLPMRRGEYFEDGVNIVTQYYYADAHKLLVEYYSKYEMAFNYVLSILSYESLRNGVNHKRYQLMKAVLASLAKKTDESEFVAELNKKKSDAESVYIFEKLKETEEKERCYFDEYESDAEDQSHEKTYTTGDAKLTGNKELMRKVYKVLDLDGLLDEITKVDINSDTAYEAKRAKIAAKFSSQEISGKSDYPFSNVLPKHGYPRRVLDDLDIINHFSAQGELSEGLRRVTTKFVVVHLRGIQFKISGWSQRQCATGEPENQKKYFSAGVFQQRAVGLILR